MHDVVLHEETSVQLGTLAGTDASTIVTRAQDIARVLGNIIEDCQLAIQVGNSDRPYVRCEGWTTLAALLGVTPHEVAVTEQDGIYTATVELRRISDGTPIARASAECGAPDEVDRHGNPIWANRPRYARRSMALTRATAKACRLAFSWIMVLAGYAPTPAEEIETVAAQPSVPTLPGKPSSWGGHGGKPITDVPEKALLAARDWCREKDPQRWATLIEAIEDELERRRAGDKPGENAQ
ncbi:MAG: hypothetical protein KatS3mg109_1341 [Pirellulaceae bacterium]|nr:MAG: hypothetical protein KatS3mg109_1203 [Pirellulaceae bacterium]GIW90909.1 MAG: hypothetical protein KatS3mg109_1341 [Pirellulaceae bacterium]